MNALRHASPGELRVALRAPDIFFAAAALFGLLVWVGDVHATECDALLTVVDDNPYAYRQRGDRCEGIYVRGVAASPLRLRSLTRSFADFNAGTGKPLQIHWSPVIQPDPALRLRAESLRRRLYYRMDTVQALGQGQYRWPSDLLASLGIARRDLGLVGIARQRIGDVVRTLYVPIDISQGAANKGEVRCELVLWPGVELTEVFVTVRRLLEDGAAGVAIEDRVPLGYGYYPAERPIRIPRPEICEAGVYHLEIGAMLRGAGTSTLDIWVASSGE